MTPTRDVEAVVVGAGVVGLAVAERLARDRGVLVVEAHEGPARETSAHNSGVVHAGIYYPTGSLKHRLCLEGNAALAAWCQARGVPFSRTGKLVVACTEAERAGLDAVYQQALANDVPGIERWSAAQVRALEPRLDVVEAVWSPSTGVVDAFAFARSIEAAARDRGALFAYRHRVTAIVRRAEGFAVDLLDDAGARSTVVAAVVVNAAGLAAHLVAQAAGYPLDGGDHEGVPVPPLRQIVNLGRYYDIDARHAGRLSRPVYPLPEHEAGGLGLHLTVDIEGGLHLGPSTEWVEGDPAWDYRHVETPAWRARFLEAGRRFIPDLEDGDLAPGQVGYRPKLQRPGGPPADFLLWHDRGYVHLGGIESPGLTAALPLAREVTEAVG